MPHLLQSDDIAPSPFIDGTAIQWAWDQTSLGLYKECAYKYFLVMVEGWRSSDESVHLTFGHFIDVAFAAYERLRAEGGSFEDGVRAAVRKALEISVDWKSEDGHKNRHTLIRTVVWYYEMYRDDSMKTIILDNGKPAYELSFKIQLDYGPRTGIFYVLCGHIDRAVDFAGGIYATDRKTSKNELSDAYFQQYSPDNQMSMYSFAMKVGWHVPVKGVIIDGIQTLVGASKFRRAATFRNDGILDEWIGDTKYWLAQALWSAENNVWPRNDKSCHKYGGCQFIKICSLSPEFRKNFLETGFRKEAWNPLAVREV